jgi:hypothetical protein
MSPPLLATLQQQSQRYQTESTQLIRLFEQLLANISANTQTSPHTTSESDNTQQLNSLSSHTALLSRIKTLNDEQSQRLGDLQTVLNECVIDAGRREYDLIQRELELAKTENSILKQQHEVSIQLTKKEVELAKIETESEKKAFEIKLKDELLSQKEPQHLNNAYDIEKKRYYQNYHHQVQLSFPPIIHLDPFYDYSDQCNLVDNDSNASQPEHGQKPNYDIVEAESSNMHTLSPFLDDKYIKSLAICFNDYNSDKHTLMSTTNSILGRLVHSTVKQLQDQFKQLRIDQDKLHTTEEGIKQLHINLKNEKEIKQQQIALNKREQAFIKREKIVNDWMDAQFKPVMKCVSHNMKTWEDAEAQRKKDEAGKGEKDQTQTRLRALFKITNLNKQISLFYSVSYSKEPLLSSLYKTSLILPVFEHFLKRDYESGKIPQLTDDLKLYFSTPSVMNGKWIQFHGPGSLFDKNGRFLVTMGNDGKDNDIVLSGFSLCDFNKKKQFYSTSDLDRCNLTADECKDQHKPTDYNYGPYHCPPTEQSTNDFVIKIKWD